MESFSLFPHASASGENEGCKCAFLHFQDPAVICSTQKLIVISVFLWNGKVLDFAFHNFYLICDRVWSDVNLVKMCTSKDDTVLLL